MRYRLWLSISAVAGLTLGSACGHESVGPLFVVDDSLLAAVSVDPALTSEAGQASLPGLLAAPATTFTGSLSTVNSCVYDASIGRIVCAPVVRNGLTYSRSIAYYDSKGIAQPARNADTREMNTKITVKGTTTTKKGPLTVDRASSLTLSQLAKGSLVHTMNGTETGTSVGTFVTSKGTVTSTEQFDAISADVVVPATGKVHWPLSGTTTRVSTITVTIGGGATRSSTMSETVTYTGTNIVTVTMSHDGKTRNCTKDLATGKLTCG